MNCLIVSNGFIEDYNFYKDILKNMDFIICVDGGARHLINFGIKPNVIIGDLDSILSKDREFFMSQDVEFVKFPADKDATDTELATELALEKNPETITYIGVLGSRMDHTLANINLLKKSLDRKVKAKIVNEKNEIYLIDSEMEIEGNKNEFISIIPVTDEVIGVTLQGLKYPLSNVRIKFGSTWGISNEFIAKKAKIQIKKGMLLVIKSRD
ncbi:thiamine diphosphokinase [Caminicella sporogenes DSM 14501]|uniref:Thiamine diphosphokinase n=1 Tax=Caminicella sporogenes DSM 14501 TaxID=1121266 RepID=A0A1M6LH96_9FIRM|nr:thiamine diphosphokinase [Caminicella sporogenes]RKD27830.1 thiamine diphosphokinase [Caminicella sporogenes]SHJ70553.1 thiamine diphosphokinase [Caminicella sporogenes DSM 14501]